MYRTSPIFPLVYFFFFGVQNRFFFCPQKKKRFWPPPGWQYSDFPRRGYAPFVKRQSTRRARLSLSGIAAKRQPAPNGWAVAPAGQATYSQMIKGCLFAEAKFNIAEPSCRAGYDPALQQSIPPIEWGSLQGHSVGRPGAGPYGSGLFKGKHLFRATPPVRKEEEYGHQKSHHGGHRSVGPVPETDVSGQL